MADLGHARRPLARFPGGSHPGSLALPRLEEVLEAAAASGEARHVYVTGGSLLGPEQESDRYGPVVAACRRAVGDRLTATCGLDAVDKVYSERLRDAGADSCCYNMETWDAETFRAALPGKARYVGWERWIAGLVDAVDVVGWGTGGFGFCSRDREAAAGTGNRGR